MPQQIPLIFDSFEAALDHVVSALGGYKVVGGKLRPGKSPEAAAGWLRDRLNANRREALSLEDMQALLRLAREAGIHEAMNYLAADCGYGAPPPLDPVDARDSLLREFNASVARLEKLQRQLAEVAGPLEWQARVRGRSA